MSVAAVGTRRNGICQELKIALGAVAPTPLRAREAEEMIRGKRISEKRIKDAAAAAVKQAKPMRMNAFKVQITISLVERALHALFQ